MKKFLNGLKEKNPKKLVSGVMDVVHLSIVKNQVVNLLEAYFTLGEVYLHFGNVEYALTILANLNTLCCLR